MTRTRSHSTRLSFSVLLAAGTLAVGCGSPPVSIGGALYAAGSIERHPDGTLAKGRLVTPASIRGYLAQDWVRFHADGTVQQLELYAPARVHGHMLPRDTHLWFAADGHVESAWLGSDLTIDGVPVNGGGKISTGFHPDGSLSSVFLAEDAVIDGIPCAASLMVPVLLATDGTVQSAKLAGNVSVDGRAWSRGERFERAPAQGR